MTVSEDFTGLTGRFRGELLAHCYRMLGSAEEAEDLVQETYLRAWRSYEGFEGRSSVRTWLYRIAVNVSLNKVSLKGAGAKGRGEPLDALLAALPQAPAEPVPGPGGPRRVALVGRPNVGKSSLLNKLAGQDRVLVDAVAGTTRDPVDELIDRQAEANFWDPSSQLRVVKKKGKVPDYPARSSQDRDAAPAGWGD